MVAASAYWAGPAEPTSARGGGTERLPPPHTLLPPAQPRRIPEQRRQRAPAASQLRAAERPAAGATGRDLARRCSLLLRAAGKYLADCEQVSLERGWRERTRGVGETERGKMSAQLCYFMPGLHTPRENSELIPSFHPDIWGTVGVKAGAPGRVCSLALLAGY